MTAEPEAAVERVTRGVFGPDTLYSNINNADLRSLLSALAEANERASLLRDTVRTRCAERDEARKALAASEARRGELEAALTDIANPLAMLERDAEAQGRVLGGRAWDIANNLHFVQGIAKAALNPQQEGSRDHG